jgi:hypothetical protein
LTFGIALGLLLLTAEPADLVELGILLRVFR